MTRLISNPNGIRSTFSYPTGSPPPAKLSTKSPIPRRTLRVIASISSDLRVDGHRADLVILKAARAHAAYEGRKAINDRDITIAIRLTIPHRLKRGPFNDAQADLNAVESAVDEKRQEIGEGEEAGEFSENSDEQAAQTKKKVSL